MSNPLLLFSFCPRWYRWHSLRVLFAKKKKNPGWAYSLHRLSGQVKLYVFHMDPVKSVKIPQTKNLVQDPAGIRVACASLIPITIRNGTGVHFRI